MRICPNFNIPEVKQEFDELKSVLGENVAYYVWNENNGYSLDYAPNGAQSKLFNDLYDYYKDRSKTIQAKAKTLSKSFKQWFEDSFPTFDPTTGELLHVDTIRSKAVDYNGEPLVMWHRSPYGGITTFDPSKIDGDDGFWFSKDKHYYLKEDVTPAYPVFLKINNPFEIPHHDFLVGMDGTHFSFEEMDKDWSRKGKKEYDGLITYEEHVPEFYGDTYGIDDYGIFISVRNPNQIKSIDNNGQFSVNNNNIYYYIKDNIPNRTTDSYYAGSQSIGELFTDIEQSAKQVLRNFINSSNYLDGAQYQLAQQLHDSISDNVMVRLTNGQKYIAAYQSGIIYVNVDAFKSYNNYDIANALLHEMVHHFTINQYNGNNKFRQEIDDIFDKYSKLFPKNKYKRQGLYYGLTTPQEFIAEIYANKAFRDAVAKKDMPLWRKLLYSLLNALKLNKIANRLWSDDLYDAYNAISDVINNRKLNPNLEDTGEMLFYAPDIDVEWLEGDAKTIINNAINGLKASEKALSSRDKNPVVITRLKQDITKYTLMLQKGEDQQILSDFIKRSSSQFKLVLNRIRNAINNPELLTNDDLRNFRNDFLDFYGPITEDINRKLFLQGYFNNLPPNQLAAIKSQLNYINSAYQEIQGKYNYLLKQRVIKLFKEYGQRYNIPTDDIEKFINDELNSSVKDMNMLYRYMQFMSNSSDMGLRMINRIMSDINSQIQWYTNNKTQDLIRQFKDITKQEQLLYFEKDKDGKTTGYLVRPLNYGQFKKDYSMFLRDLDQKYGVVDQNYYLLEGEDFINYCNEKEKWLSEHCERRFKPEYYKAYNKLSQLAREKSKMYTEQITAIIENVTDEDGPHLERLTDQEWTKLDQLYSLKSNLHNEYYLDGTKKQGDDLQIAQEFQRFYDEIGHGTIKSKQLSQKEVLDLMSRKQKELSPELYSKWFRRNISVQYNQDFTELLKKFGNKDFGEDTEKYNKLYEERRQLLQLGKDNNSPLFISDKYQKTVKERIVELDQELNDIRSKYQQGNKQLFEYVTFVTTPYYERDKILAQKKGNDAYAKWFKENHYLDKYGNYRPASYYSKIVPKKEYVDKFTEYRLSRMNLELDKNSEMINPNYNFSDPEYYQPKKSLYDNSEAYENATKTEAQLKVYNTIVDTMDEANSKLSFMSKRDNYRLPQATGDFIDFTMRQGNFFKNFGRMVRDAIVVKNDDVDFALDNSITKADGTQLNLVPTHYVQMLENPENISRNIIGLLSAYSKMAENYRLKNQYASEFEVIQDMYNDRTFIRTNRYNAVTSKIEGSQSNTSSRLQDYLQLQLYGKTTRPWTVDIGKYSISVTKIMNNLRGYASASNLGNNALSILKSIVQGLDKIFVEGFSGQFYTIGDIAKSFVRQLWRTPKRIMNIGNQYQDDITFALLEHNGIAHDSKEKVDGLQYYRVFRILYKYLIWGGWQASDFMIKGPIVESVYANFKYIPETGKFMSFPAYEKLFANESMRSKRKRFNNLNTVSALDILEVQDGKLRVKDQYKQYEEAFNDKNVQQSLRNISYALCSRIDGQLREEDKLMILQNAIGAAIGMHRSFFVVNLNENIFKGYNYNPLIEDYDDAKYRSGFVGIGKWLCNLYYAVKYFSDQEKYIANKKNFTNPQLYNMKRILAQTAIIGMLYLLVAIWLSPMADDDKDNYQKQALGYIFDAVRYEELSEYNPLDLVNQFKSPSAAIAPFENIVNLVNPFKLDKNYSTDIVKTGYYKGQPRWQRTLIKSVPGLRGAWESRDARTKWQYLKSQLDK